MCSHSTVGCAAWAEVSNGLDMSLSKPDRDVGTDVWGRPYLG